METLIKDIHADWRNAKARAEQRCARAGQHGVAAKLAACDMFTGAESLSGMVELMFAPQGIEFMTKFGFPDMKTFRRFIPYHPERYNVYIDAREIAVTDAKRVYVIGNTFARIQCAKTQNYTIVLMHGARADVMASGYAVVKIEHDAKSRADVHVFDHVIVNV